MVFTFAYFINGQIEVYKFVVKICNFHITRNAIFILWFSLFYGTTSMECNVCFYINTTIKENSILWQNKMHNKYMKVEIYMRFVKGWWRINFNGFYEFNVNVVVVFFMLFSKLPYFFYFVWSSIKIVSLFYFYQIRLLFVTWTLKLHRTFWNFIIFDFF